MRTCAHVCMIRVWDISINYCVLRGIYPSTTLCFEEYIHQLLTLICLVCLEGHLNPCDSRASTCMRACVRACVQAGVCAAHKHGMDGFGHWGRLARSEVELPGGENEREWDDGD